MHLPPHSPARRRAGLTLLEVTLALAMLAVGLMAMTTTTLATSKLRRADSDRQEAVAAIESLLEEIQIVADSTPKDGTDWAETVLTRFAAPADVYPVAGLDPWPGEPGVLSLSFVTDETATDAALGFPIGMPRDLDNDGAADNGDVRATARVLPVLVRARWRTTAGDRELTQGTYVLGY